MGLLNGAVAKLSVEEQDAGYISGVDLEVSVDVDDIKVLGEGWAKANPNFKSWKADIDGYYDPEDEGQQLIFNAIKAGTEIAIKIYEDETHFYSGNAIVENIKIAIKDGTTEVSGSIKGNGELTFPTYD